MPTDIDIASNALLLIGDEPISSFTEPGAGPEVAAAIYPEDYKQVLSEHPWSFALKEQVLSQLSQTPDDKTGFSFAYQLPTDLIRLWAIFDWSEYVIIGDLLYSNENSLLARYVYKVPETSLPPHFVVALQYKLAADFAISITESNSKSEMYEKKYRMALAQARAVDSQGRPQESIIDSPFVDVRFSGRGLYSRG
jgi:hypothetical protein